MPAPSLFERFSALEDPRQAGKVLYPLPEIMPVVLCATLAGAEDFVEIRAWGDTKIGLSHVRCCPSRAVSPRMTRSMT